MVASVALGIADTALRRALEKAYPGLADLELVDYKVRILDGKQGTGAVTRVLVETSDGLALQCADVVCCNAACTGVCQACDQTGNVGRCLPVPVDQDPDEECAEEAPETCGRDGACDGVGACARSTGTSRVQTAASDC